MKKTNKSIGGVVRVILSVAVICGILAVFAFRQSAVSAQGRENDVSPSATDVIFSSFVPITINDNANASPYPSNIVVNNPSLTTVSNIN